MMIKKSIKRGLSVLMIFIISVGLFITAFPVNVFAANPTADEVFKDFEITSLTVNNMEFKFEFTLPKLENYKERIYFYLWQGHMATSTGAYTEVTVAESDYNDSKGLKNKYAVRFDKFDYKGYPQTLKLMYTAIPKNSSNPMDTKIVTDHKYFIIPQEKQPEFDINVISAFGKDAHRDKNTVEFEVIMSSTGKGHKLNPDGSFYNPFNEKLFGSMVIEVRDSENNIMKQEYPDLENDFYLNKIFTQEYKEPTRGSGRITMSYLPVGANISIRKAETFEIRNYPKITKATYDFIGSSPTEYSVVLHPEFKVDWDDGVYGGMVEITGDGNYPLVKKDGKFTANLGSYPVQTTVGYKIHLDCHSGYYEDAVPTYASIIYMPDEYPTPPRVKTSEASGITINQAILEGKIEKINTPYLTETGFK